MTTFRAAAIQILKGAKEPMHYRAITDMAIEKALITTEGQTPEHTMRVTLRQESMATNPAVVDRGRGVFSFNPGYAGDKQGRIRVPDAAPGEEPVPGDNRYVGMAGEYRVASELFLRGYNASITNVDEGIDVIAIKKRHISHIQVKTSNQRRNRHIFDLGIKAYKKNQFENVYYVFVLFGESRTRFLIMPYHELTKHISQGSLRVISKGSRYRAVITLQGDKVFLGKVGNDVTYYLDRWEMLR